MVDITYQVNVMRRWAKGERPGPFHIQLNPTDRCNLKCRFCWLRDTARVSYENEITLHRYMEIIDEAAELGVKRITVTGGGEPFCRPDVTLRIIESAKKRGMYGFMITNGTMFDENAASTIIKSGWDEVMFSLDAQKEEIVDYLRNTKKSFRKTVNAITLLDRMKRESNSRKPKIVIHSVLCNQTYNHIPELVEFAADNGVSNIFVEPLVLVQRDAGQDVKLKLSEEQIKESQKYLRDAYERCCEYEIETNMEHLLDKRLVEKTNQMNEIILNQEAAERTKDTKNSFLSLPCYEPWWNMVVRPNGRAGPCCMFDYTAEYVHKRKLSDIWYGSYFENIRRTIINNKLMDFCSKCNPSQVVENREIRKMLNKCLDGKKFGLNRVDKILNKI